MKSYKKLILSVLIIIFILSAIFYLVYLNMDREINKLKRGKELPILWEAPDDYHATLYKWELDESYIEDLKIQLTDLYYLKETQKINFGMLIKKSDYKSKQMDKNYFRVELHDEKGNVYYGNIAHSIGGVFEVFILRSITRVDLNQVEQLEMFVYPRVIQDGEVVELEPSRMIIYNKDTNPLTEVER